MGFFVKIDSKYTKHYEAVSSTAFKNFLGFISGLKFQKTTKIGKSVASEVYYDTPTHLLNKSGVVLSKFREGQNAFFKVENTSFLSKVLNKLQKEVFVHPIGAGDNLTDHGFYIKDGIISLYSTSFSVDLENVIKNAVPKMEVVIKADIYQLTSGTGMRAKIALENKFIKNLETKRKYEVKGITVKLENENKELFTEDFNSFNALIEKNCKEFIPIDENQFDFATKVTKPLPPKEKKPKEKKKKDKF